MQNERVLVENVVLNPTLKKFNLEWLQKCFHEMELSQTPTKVEKTLSLKKEELRIHSELQIVNPKYFTEFESK